MNWKNWVFLGCRVPGAVQGRGSSSQGSVQTSSCGEQWCPSLLLAQITWTGRKASRGVWGGHYGTPGMCFGHKSNPDLKLLPRQGLQNTPLQRGWHRPRLVLLGAALALLQAEPVKPRAPSNPPGGSSCRWGTSRDGCSERDFLRKRGLSNPAKTGQTAGGAKPEPAWG